MPRDRTFDAVLRGYLSGREQVRLDGGGAYRFHGHTPPRRFANEIPAGPASGGVAILRLYDPIDSWGGEWGVSATEFVAALDALPADVTTIELHVNSPGGEVFEGVAILNALRQHSARTVAVVDGIAASAASFIAVGCDELVMGDNAELMIHDARGICIGNAADMQQMTDLLNHLSTNVATVYAKKAGGSVADWRTAMLAESWFSAQEAVDAGLADRVAEAKGQPSNGFDTSLFRYTNRAAAPAPAVARSEVSNAMTPDESALTQALGWFTAIDNIVDEAQESLAAQLGVPNPDSDDDGNEPAEPDGPPASAVSDLTPLRFRLKARPRGVPA